MPAGIVSMRLEAEYAERNRSDAVEMVNCECDSSTCDSDEGCQVEDGGDK